MIQQLTLDRGMSGLDGTRFKVIYRREFTDPKDPRLDGSHIHDCYEFYFNLTGDVSFFVNNRMYKIKKGDVIFTRRGDMHFCVYHKPTLHEFFCLWIRADEGTAIGDFIEEKFRDSFYSYGEDGDKLSDELFRLTEGIENKEGLEASASLLSFLLLAGKGGKNEGGTVHSYLPKDMQRIVDYVTDNFTEIHTVSDIAEHFYISPSTLNRRFKKYIQMSPRVFLEEKKLSYAKQLLLGGASVTDACFSAGFSDSSHFISIFKRRFGETPYKYKVK
jgi:AraC-like DNA-binding protein